MAAITGNKGKGMPARMRAIEVAAGITSATTRSDRQPMERRLRAAEVAGSITINVKLGLLTRLTALEAHVW
jgi:hypothetical protein